MQPVQHPSSATSGVSTTRTISAVILAGRLRQAPLQEALNLHPLCLPVGKTGTLLEAWLGLLSAIPGVHQVKVVVNTADEAAAVRSVLPREAKSAGHAMHVDVMAEPRSWRGAGGIVKDVTEGAADESIVLVCEGTRLPPMSIDPVLSVMHAGTEATDSSGPVAATVAGVVAGVVGVTGEDAPAGVYAFRRSALALVPRVGYCDLKEQFLPTAAEEGLRVVIARMGGETTRLRDLRSYLDAVGSSLSRGAPGQASAGHLLGAAEPAQRLRVSPRASVSGSAVLDGFCIIEPGAVIEDGAVVHDSVVLWGATVGGGAVVSRSVVGPLAAVEPRTRVVHSIASREEGATRIR